MCFIAAPSRCSPSRISAGMQAVGACADREHRSCLLISLQNRASLPRLACAFVPERFCKPR